MDYIRAVYMAGRRTHAASQNILPLPNICINAFVFIKKKAAIPTGKRFTQKF
jgi:hypothetical protein